MTAKIVSQSEYKKNFYKKVLKLPSGCWIWMAAIQGKYYKNDNGGYGSVRHNQKVKPAHRVSYEMHHGSIQEGLHIDHLCRITSCVNPDHLEAVAPAENYRRGVNNKGENQSSKTHCKNGHEYTEENTVNLKDYKTDKAYRACRTCRKETYKRSDARRGRNKA